MTQSPVTVTYPLEQVLGRIEQKLEQKLDKLDSKIDKLDSKIDNLQKDVNDFKTETKVALESVKGEINNIDTRLSNLEKTVDEIKSDTKRNTTDIADIKIDLADLKGWRSFIVPFFTALVVAAFSGVINWAIRK